MPLTYEIIFKSQGEGGQPTSFKPSDSSQGSTPASDRPKVPTQPEKPQSPPPSSGNLTPSQIDEMVARASEKASAERTQIPAEKSSGQRPEPQQPVLQPSPARPAGEATLDAIRAATQRSTEDARREERARQLIDSGVRGEAQDRVVLEVPKPDPSLQRPPAKQPEQPQAATQPAPSVGNASADDVMSRVNDEARRRGEEDSKGASSTPDSQAGTDDGEFRWPDERPQPRKSPQPGPRAGEFNTENLKKVIESLSSGGLKNIGSIGSLVGAAGASAGVAAGAFGAAQAWMNARAEAIDTTAPFSPEVMRARSEAEAKEIQRRVELARKYGEQDAAVQRTMDTYDRTKQALWDEAIRNPQDALWMNTPFFGQLVQLRYAITALTEVFRDTKVTNPVDDFGEEYEQLPDPWEFQYGKADGTAYQSSTHQDTITGL